MDAEISHAVAVVDIEPSRAAEWFDLVNVAYSASNDDWDKFSEQLRSAAGGTFDTAAETFLKYAADHGKTELIGKLLTDLPELPTAYASSRAAAGQPRSQAADSPWDTVVRQFGSGWAGWDGSETGWARFRDWTYSSANAQHPDLYAAAYATLNPLNERPLADRIAALTGFGFTVNARPAPSAEQPARRAGSLWETVVRQFGPSWANWDGSDAGWARFRDWTYSSANGQDPEMYAAAYEKLHPLNELPPAERIARLTGLGFPAPAAQPAGQPSTEGSSALDRIIEESLAEAIRELPGSEALTPEQLARMRIEIAEELAREAAQ